MSGSAQLPSGTMSGSGQLPSGTMSGSGQLPSGVISGSAQLPSGVISGSSQLSQGFGNISGSSTSTGSFGTIQIGGKQVYGDASGIGIGIPNPLDILHLSDGTAETRLQIENTGTGDPILMLQTDGLKNWYMGIDRSDSHKLHWHSTGGAWDPDNAQMALSLEGDLTLSGSFESQFGNISGSSVSTGSFGRVEATTLKGDGSGLTGVVDDGALAFSIVFGG